MKLRTLLTFGILAAAVSAPFLFSGGGSFAPTESAQFPDSPFGLASNRVMGTASTPNGGSDPGAIADLAQVFSFDVTPDWVISHWPRISSCPGEDGLTGLRLPLVTGPRREDLLGSLTYYFDDRHQLQRIVFKGWTGDASRLTAFVTNEFDFSERRSSGYGLFTLSYWGTPKGVLRVDYAPVIRQEIPNQRLSILLEINNPAGGFGLSQHVAGILSTLQ